LFKLACGRSDGVVCRGEVALHERSVQPRTPGALRQPLLFCFFVKDRWATTIWKKKTRFARHPIHPVSSLAGEQSEAFFQISPAHALCQWDQY